MVGPFGLEVAGDVISGLNVEIIEGYVDTLINVEVSSSSSFQDIQTQVFPTPSAFRLKCINED